MPSECFRHQVTGLHARGWAPLAPSSSLLPLPAGTARTPPPGFRSPANELAQEIFHRHPAMRVCPSLSRPRRRVHGPQDARPGRPVGRRDSQVFASQFPFQGWHGNIRACRYECACLSRRSLVVCPSASSIPVDGPPSTLVRTLPPSQQSTRSRRRGCEVPTGIPSFASPS